MKYLVFFVLIATHSWSFAANKHKTEFFFQGFENLQLHPQKAAAIQDQISLYKKIGKIQSFKSSEQKQVEDTMDDILKALKEHTSHQQPIPVKLKKKGYKALHGSRTVNITFPSQYKLLNKANHPRNNVFGKIFYSPNYSGPVHYIVLLPHVNDDISKVVRLANTIVGASQGEVGAAILYPPLYGRRGLDTDKYTTEYTDKNGQFISYQSPKFIVPDKDETFHNMVQTMVDLHSLKLFLKHWRPVKGFSMKAAKKEMTLAGPSLGGIITLGYAGLVGGFDKYLSLAGGGNIPLFMDQLIERQDVVLAIAQSFLDADWTFQDSLEAFLAFDPLVWAPQVHSDAKIMMINACNDEFLQPQTSVLNLQSLFKGNAKKVIGHWNFWGHNPENASQFALLNQFVHPLIDFAQGKDPKKQSYKKTCL